MNKNKNYQFLFNWILNGKLAIGTSPTKKNDINILKENKISNILGLCSDKEISWHKEVTKNFLCKRIEIPDSKYVNLATLKELEFLYINFKELVNKNPTFVHCYASIERSPLICIMYIMEKYKLNLEDSLDYVVRVHPSTNPTNKQLNLINKFMKSKFS